MMLSLFYEFESNQVWIKKSGFFFPKMTLPDVPKIRFLDFCLDFFSKNDASSVPVFWIFFQDSRIGVNNSLFVIAYKL